MSQNEVNSAELEQMQGDLNVYIERKRSRNKEMVSAIDQDSRLIYDYLVPSDKIRFVIPEVGKKPVLSFNEKDDKLRDLTLHDHAVGQIAEKMGIPGKYLKDHCRSSDPWRNYLAKEIMDTHMVNAKQERFLVRAVGNETRGIMSDSFKRFNSIVLYSTFLAAAQASGAVVADAHYDGLTGYLEVLRPDVITIPTENNGIQYICFGLQFSNSDFGARSMNMRAFNFVIKCLNGWVNQTVIREVHRGSRLPDNLELSEKTYRLDTETKASVIKDTIDSLLDPKTILKNAVRIQESSKIMIDIESEVKILPKLGVHEYEAEALKKIFMENNPDNNIGGENTLFKLTQGLSAVARDSDASRKRELDDITGKLFERIRN